jgi:uncharacterized coiled-coil protein SlyX
MKGRKTFAGAVILAAILVVGWLVVPTEAGDDRHFGGLSEHRLRELSIRFKIPVRVLRELHTILVNDQLVLAKLADLAIKLDDLQLKMDDVQTACLPPDLLPVPPNGGSPLFPGNFCFVQVVGGQENLVVRVQNQGLTPAGASTLRVAFITPSGPVESNVGTPALAGSGGSIDLLVPIHPDCSLPLDEAGRRGACNFLIAVDADNVVVGENSETNNNVAGACVPIL